MGGENLPRVDRSLLDPLRAEGRRSLSEGCGRTEREFALAFQRRCELPMELRLYDIAQHLVCSRSGSGRVGIKHVFEPT